MVDSVSGSGGVPPVKQVNKAVVKPSEVETVQDFDAVEISDEAIALAQAAEVRGQLEASDAGLSGDVDALKALL